MVRLHERFLADLPVHWHDLGDVGCLVPIGERQLLEMGVEPFEEIGKRVRVRIRVDEDETLPGVDQRFGQVIVSSIDVGEVPLAGDLLERTIVVPAPTVEGDSED